MTSLNHKTSVAIFPAKHLLAIGAMSLLISLFYSNSFTAPFILDDLDNIKNDASIQISSFSFRNLQRASQGLNSTRLLPNMSFALNYYMGKHSVWGYHLFNLIVHILASISFYWLAFRTLTLPRLSVNSARACEISLITALIWSLHPVQTNAVTYIVQRMTSMSALFCFVSLVFFVEGRLSGLKSYKLLFFLLSAFSGGLALLSKQNAAMLPLLIIAYNYYFISESQKLSRRGFTQLIAAALFVTGLAWLYLGGNPATYISAGYVSRDFDVFQRLLTETRVVVFYVSLIFLPLASRLNLCHDFDLSTGFLDPPNTALALSFMVLVSFYTVHSFKKHKLLSFAFFWFLANLVIESSIIPLEIVFEHRLYLPSAMLFLALTTQLYSCVGKSASRYLSILLIIGLTVLTWQRNSVWSSEVRMWSDVVKKSPNLARGYKFLGAAYIDAGMHDEAYNVFKKVEDKEFDSVGFYNNWGRAAFETNKIEEATKHFQKAISIDPQYAESHYNLGIAYGSLGRREEARREMMLGMRLRQNSQ